MQHDLTGDQIAALIRKYTFRWSNEDDLQAGIHAALASAGVTSEREVRLSARDRIDLLVGSVGIEVKVARPGNVASAERVTTQLQRYAQHPQISELVLVSTTRRHSRVPSKIGDVTVHTVIVGGLR